jgi:hypothetical protein
LGCDRHSEAKQYRSGDRDQLEFVVRGRHLKPPVSSR